MEGEGRLDVLRNESYREPSNAEPASISDINDRKDDDEEEEEEEEEDKIIEKSHNSRFHKRNKRFPKKIEGVDDAFFATEPKSGKEVIWNECILSDKKTDKENRYLNIIKKLKRNSHPFLARFLDAWITIRDDGTRKLNFITERLDECTLKQFLCNSAKNNRMWQRHVGQLLSVLMFLHGLGITHGSLTKESIFFQNNGNLRVGPFALGGCLDHKAQSSDIFSLGVIALEIAVWTPTDFPENLGPSEEHQLMLSRLENDNQKSFIEACLDPNPDTRYRLKRLINHPAVSEVPMLKLLAAKVIVESVRVCSNEDGTSSEQQGFVTLLKDYLSHYEDETIIMEVRFPHDNIVNSRSWKDFRSNFTLTPKYLDDVKNGFYPFFGCRWNWTAYQEDEEESVSFTAPATGISQPGGLATGMNPPMSVSNASSGGCLPRVDSSSLVSQGHSSAPSSAPSASVSRKQSSSMKNVDMSVPTDMQATVEEVDEERTAMKPLTVGEVENPPTHPDAVGQSQRAAADNQLTAQSVRATSVPGTGGHSTPFPGEPNMDSVGSSLAPPPPPTPISAAAPGSVPLSSRDSLLEAADEAAIVENKHPPPRSTTPLTTDMPTGGEKPLPDLVPRETAQGQEGSTSAAGEPHLPTDRQPTSQENAEGQEGEVAEGEEPEPEQEEDEEEEEDEEDEEDEGNKATGVAVERCEPQTIHVMPPEKPPSHPALFTHCQYFYIGAGRWQVYLQMWFIEDRLKREAYIQVFDYEWHNCERVADIFEASRCLNRADRPSLIRYLGLARHNCPLVDGEIQVPGAKGSTSGLNTFELSEKLTALRLHRLAKKIMKRSGTGQKRTSGGSGSRRYNRRSNRRSEKTSSAASQAPKPMATQSTTTATQEAEAEESKSVACAEHLAQFQTQQQAAATDNTSTSKTPAATAAAAPVVGHVKEPVSLFFDIGSLAPRNLFCALCDTHDYLHREELPAYLVSPCYHCREALAKEAKVSPEVLLDLHLQNHIPWPAFLQARFKLPIDGRTLDELIAYDCRWRSRQPCKCLAASGGPILPPCVEFPWLYPQPQQQSSSSEGQVSSPKGTGQTPATTTTTVAASPVAASTGEATEGLRQSVPPVTSRSSEGQAASPQSSADQPSTSGAATATRAGGSHFPCSHRHSRGAPTICCHNKVFPKLATSSHGNRPQQHTASAEPAVRQQQHEATTNNSETTVVTSHPTTAAPSELAPQQLGSTSGDPGS